MAASVRNVARDKLAAGELSLGVGIRLTRSVEIAKAMAVAGFMMAGPVARTALMRKTYPGNA